MKFLLIVLLAVACQAYTPIEEQSWVTFQKVKEPTYETVPLHEELNNIHATDILIEERISTLATMVRKSVRDFHATNEEVHDRTYSTNQKNYCKSRLWICKETRAPTSIRNVVQPPRTGYFWD